MADFDEWGAPTAPGGAYGEPVHLPGLSSVGQPKYNDEYGLYVVPEPKDLSAQGNVEAQQGAARQAFEPIPAQLAEQYDTHPPRASGGDVVSHVDDQQAHEPFYIGRGPRPYPV